MQLIDIVIIFPRNVTSAVRRLVPLLRGTPCQEPKLKAYAVVVDAQRDGDRADVWQKRKTGRRRGVLRFYVAYQSF